MKQFAVIILVALLAYSAFGKSNNNEKVVFEATVVRVQPWPLIALSCGTYMQYRVVEYRVVVGYTGNLKKGQKLTVEHTACNYTELNELRVGDKVVVVAEKLPESKSMYWERKPESEKVTVTHQGERVALLVYPPEQHR